MTLMDLLAVALATSVLIDTWLRSDTIVSDIRDRLITWVAAGYEDEPIQLKEVGALLIADVNMHPPHDLPRSLWYRFRLRLEELLECGYCLAYHVPVYLILFMYIPSVLLAYNGYELASMLGKLPLYALAITRLVTWSTCTCANSGSYIMRSSF